MLPSGSVVVAMVSGGGDSTALVHLLATGAVCDGVELRALHVNHLLRDEESEADEAFVRDVCGSLGVPLSVVRYDVAAYAEERGLNLEDAGRQVRYRFAEEELDAACDAAGVPGERGRIATGHTRDDRVETFLMRLAQGAGPGGLTSLKAVRGRIVRPLITTSRDELRAYLDAHELAWREDASNRDTARLRARVRHDLVPVLREINPRFDDAVERALEVLGDEDELLSEMAEAFARDFTQVSDGEVAFDRAKMVTLSVPMRRRAVRAALARALPDASRLEFDHIEALVRGLADPSFARDLPQGLRAFGEYDRMVVSRSGDTAGSLAPRLLPIPGMLDLGPGGRLHAEETAGDPVFADATIAVVDAEGIAEFVVDAVREGDRMRPLGMKGTKKLSDVLVDAKVPRRQRGITPVVRDGERVVWLAGVRMSDEYKVDEGTTRAVRLTWEPPLGSTTRV